MSAEQQNSHQNLKNIYCPCQLHMTDQIFLNTKVKNYCRILAVLSLVITRYTWSLKVKHEHILWLAGHVHVYLCLISSVFEISGGPMARSQWFFCLASGNFKTTSPIGLWNIFHKKINDSWFIAFKSNNCVQPWSSLRDIPCF